MFGSFGAIFAYIVFIPLAEKEPCWVARSTRLLVATHAGEQGITIGDQRAHRRRRLPVRLGPDG